MTDQWSRETRSQLMSRVKTKNTRPELVVRSLLHKMGYRFRLHRRDLPGSPDIVLPKYQKAIFVHGCFWHGHNCKKGKRPTSNHQFWNAKLDRNLERDRTNQEALIDRGWEVLVVWECELSKQVSTREKLLHFIKATQK